MTKKAVWITLSLLLMLTACSDFIDSSQLHSAGVPAGEIAVGRSVGQTFIAHHDGLNGVDILLATYARLNTEPVVFHLRRSPESTTDLRTVTISAAEIADNEYHHFAFDPIHQSNGQRFYFFLDSPTSAPGNAITAWLGLWDGYQDGSAHVNGLPEDAQMVFKLHYTLDWMGLGALKTLTFIGLQTLPAALMILLPGVALSLSLLSSKQFDLRVRLTLAPALGVALYPIILAWCLPIGVRPGAYMVWTVLILSAAVLLFQFRHLASSQLPGRIKTNWHTWWVSKARNSDLATWAVVGLVMIGLFMPIQRFVAPLWGDSVQHTVIAQRIFENGGLFDSWEPYAPYRSMTTHFGFHTTVAAYMWLTGIQVAPATLVVGQVLNLVGALSLYGLILYVSRNRWAGIGTLIIVGLFSIVPTTYTNWGRYPQLTGQAILPAAVCLLWAVGESKKHRGKLAILAGLAATGMTLSYYRTPFLYAIFVAAWLATQAIPAWVRRKRTWWRDLIWLGLVAFTLSALIAPWAVLGLLEFRQIASINATATQAALSEAVVAPGPSPTPTDLGAIYGPVWQNPDYRWLLLGALGGALLAIGLRRWRVATLTGWLVGFIIIPLISSYTRNPSFVFATVIALYIPAGLLIGWAIGTVAQELLRHIPKFLQLLVPLAIVGGATYGAIGQLTALDPEFVLVTPSDLHAMNWIRDNAPTEAKFLINGIVSPDGYSVVGGDAGWWLPILTQRANSIPPQYALFTARPIEPGYTQQVNNLVHTLLTSPPTAPEGIQALCDFGITHVYIGQRRGMAVAALPPSTRPEKPMLDTAELAASELFDLVYQYDLVRVFRFNHDVCAY